LLKKGAKFGLNGHRLVADKIDATEVILALAAGNVSEHEFAEWIRARMAART
jgi:prophage maintenance system killer protein